MSESSEPSESTLPRYLNVAELESIFHFNEADLVANRRERYSAAQHRLRGTAVVLIGTFVLMLLSLPIQREVGRIFGWVAAPCFAVAGVVGLLAGIAGAAAAWNTLREGATAPVVQYTGYVGVGHRGDAYFLESDSFSIGIEQAAAEQFVEGSYHVYYVPNYVADRARLFSIEPALD